MNRIDRLIWEKTQLQEMERPRREFSGMASGKVILIVILAGLAVLFAARVSRMTLDDAVVRALVPTFVFYTPAAASNPARKMETTAAASGHGR